MNIGCLGIGQVGSIFAPALARHGAEVCCFDPRLAGGRPPVPHLRFASLEEVLTGTELVLSMVPTGVAQEVAREAAAHLGKQHVYVDLSSTSPAAKRSIAHLVAAREAVFVEGAILGLVAATGAGTRVLLAGPHAAETADVLNRHGLNCEAYRDEIGAASAFKLLRSVFSKGIEALLIETLLAAERSGVRDDVWTELCSTIDDLPFAQLARSWVTTHAVACQRRRDEMKLVIEAVEALGLTPTMSTAAHDVLDRSASAGLTAAFDTPPDDMGEVIAWLDANIPLSREAKGEG